MTGSARPIPDVICVLRNSSVYGPDDVAALKYGVGRHLGPHRFRCISDVTVDCERIEMRYQWPGWWSKMELFRPDVKGDLLYFDLDTRIVGDLSDIAKVDKLTMLSDFYQEKLVASGMMFLPQHERPTIWERWIRNPVGHIADHKGGDQSFLRESWNFTAQRWQEVLPGQVVSYKAHCREGLPKDARVVCFHGQPKPKQVKEAWA